MPTTRQRRWRARRPTTAPRSRGTWRSTRPANDTLAEWPKLPFELHSAYILVDCESLVQSVCGEACPNESIDMLLCQMDTLLKMGVRPATGKTHIVNWQKREFNTKADALAGAASQGVSGSVCAWDFAALGALGVAWAAEGLVGSCVFFVMVRMLSQSTLLLQRRGLGASFKWKFSRKARSHYWDVGLPIVSISIKPEMSRSFDSERQALEVLLDQVCYFFQGLLQANWVRVVQDRTGLGVSRSSRKNWALEETARSKK